MTREQAISIVNQERDYQDSTFIDNEVLPSGLTRAQRDSELPSHLVMLKSYIDDAFDGWTWDYKRGTDEVTVLQNVAKIAAIAVRCLERVGFGDALIERGLRPSAPVHPINRELTQ